MLLLKYNAQHVTLGLTDFYCLALEISTRVSNVCAHKKSLELIDTTYHLLTYGSIDTAGLAHIIYQAC